MIDRYLIRYFLAVINFGNFSRAAQHCGVSQPTLSVGIAKLETLLDRKLFVRTNRRVELTRAGMRFASHAQRIEVEFAQAERSVDEEERGGCLRLGIISTLPAEWIEQAIIAVHHEKPQDRIEIVEGRARDLSPMLDRDRVDAVLGIVSDDQRSHLPLFKEGYAMAMACDHPLAGCEGITPQDVGSEPMIVRRHCEVLQEISRFFTHRGIRPFIAARTANDERALAYVRAGLGVTVMPRCFSSTGVAMPTLVGFGASRSIGFQFGYDGARRLADSPSFECFANAIRQAAAVRELT